MSGEEDEGDVDKVIIEFGPDIDNIEKEIVCETEETNDIEEGSESNLFKWAETVASLDRGCWMRIKTGVPGDTPAKDNFPWYKGNNECYVRLLWDLMPSDWRLVAFPDVPKDAYDPDEYLHAKQIMIADITEVLLEVDPSVSFRIYLGDKNQVVRMTPSPLNRQHAAAWVDAIFSTMHLQNAEEEVVGKGDGCPTDDGITVNDLLDLREKFYEAHPDLIPPEYENFEDLGEADENDKAIVVHDEENPQAGMTLGAETPRTSRRFSLDYSQIYGSRRNSTGSVHLEQEKQCCVIF